MKLAIGIILILLAIGGINFWNSNRKSKKESKQGELKTVNIKDLKFNEIVHEKLSDEQINRITNFQEILKEVNTTPIAKTIENFQRDVNPDSEIVVWERIAKAYQSINNENEKLSIEDKNEVYNLLLFRSMMSREDVFKKLELKSLTLDKAKEFINYYDK